MLQAVWDGRELTAGRPPPGDRRRLLADHRGRPARGPPRARRSTRSGRPSRRTRRAGATSPARARSGGSCWPPRRRRSAAARSTRPWTPPRRSGRSPSRCRRVPARCCRRSPPPSTAASTTCCWPGWRSAVNRWRRRTGPVLVQPRRPRPDQRPRPVPHGRLVHRHPPGAARPGRRLAQGRRARGQGTAAAIPAEGLGYGVLRWLDGHDLGPNAADPVQLPGPVRRRRRRLGPTAAARGRRPGEPGDAAGDQRVRPTGDTFTGHAVLARRDHDGGRGDRARRAVDRGAARAGRCADLAGHTPSDFPLVRLDPGRRGRVRRLPPTCCRCCRCRRACTSTRPRPRWTPTPCSRSPS